jgi:hypothetical protein
MKKSAFLFATFTLMVLLLCLTISCQNKAEKAELERMKAMVQTEDQNKAIARQFFEAIDAQNYNRFNELLAPVQLFTIQGHKRT